MLPSHFAGMFGHVHVVQRPLEVQHTSLGQVASRKGQTTGYSPTCQC
eukprot:11188.XXX_93874_94014_1 [CDS] Oithona nana genome sequencing.